MAEEEGDILEDEIDPRIKEELDILNQSTDAINHAETGLTEWREKYNSSLSNATQQLQQIAKKNAKAIQKARPYYETKRELAQAQMALRRAVSNFQRANGVYNAAKETIALAETRLSEFEVKKVDDAWQEMLNRQTQKFAEADKDRRRSQALHEKATKKYEFLEKKLQMLKKKNKNSVAKTKRYFELKELHELDLQKKQRKVDELQRKIDNSKRSYSQSLKNLEQISSEIHEKRRQNKISMNILEDHSGDIVDGELVSNPLNLRPAGLHEYDDIEALEADLDDFDLEEDDEDELSSESESEEEEDDSSTAAPRKIGLLKRSNTAPESKLKSALDKGKKLTRYRGGPLRRASSVEPEKDRLAELTEQDALPDGSEDKDTDRPGSSMDTIHEDLEDVFAENVDDEKDESTYRRLHGTNIARQPPVSTQKKSLHPPEDFDIFDELC